MVGAPHRSVLFVQQPSGLKIPYIGDRERNYNFLEQRYQSVPGSFNYIQQQLHTERSEGHSL